MAPITSETTGLMRSFTIIRTIARITAAVIESICQSAMRGSPSARTYCTIFLIMWYESLCL
ncbi:hypothetical protein A605_00765 [Corynebacterium halotolerans YIM 70093 = DSM 44683]|uniref:Uncharacterized protein n=1 Tax=Corynebacterium halotolerans YIM 70093 = DSM 44683 TaxID=1121362 RepID=M1MTY9_9CORY|nr:hypothetical protein A605_00765 [Corynebacterium halotolerans YIM 70093 = DSM 44683]